MFEKVKIFEKLLGQNINLQTTGMMDIDVSIEDIKDFVNQYGLKSVNDRMYLGLPLNGNPKSFSFWKTIIEKIKRSYHYGHHFTLLNAEGSPSYKLHCPTFPLTICLYLKCLRSGYGNIKIIQKLSAER